MSNRSPEAAIAPASISVSRTAAFVELAFGPQAMILPTADNDGFTLYVNRIPHTDPTRIPEQPIVKVRVRFGPDLAPIIDEVVIKP